MNDDMNIIGEVIEASTIEFAAESRTLHSPPSFGSFVKVELNSGDESILTSSVPQAVDEDPFSEPSFRQSAGKFGAELRRIVEGEALDEDSSSTGFAIYAVVHQASTGPVDSNRQVRAYWKDEQQLSEEQPELAEWLLITKFHAIIIGYSSNQGIRQFLPPQPPKLHAKVLQCSPDEIRAITSRMDFLRTLSNSRTAPSEEVIAACIREAHAARGADFEFLVAAGKELASLMKDDYDRLHAIMRRVAP